jgi:maltose alpha-D-glucosyltransferase/alpha-amylase
MVSPADRQLMWELYAPEPRMRLNLGIRRRLAPLLDNDRRKIELANAILFSLPGAPIIYYGDEIGLGDNIDLFDRNGVRTPMPWTAEPGAGFSTADPADFWAPLIADETYGYHKVNVAAQMADPNSLFQTIKQLIASRKAHPVLGEGDCQFLDTGQPAILTYLRRSDSAHLLIVANLAGQRQAASLALPQLAGIRPSDVLSGTTLPPVGESEYTLTLLPYQCYWLDVSDQR